MWADCAWKLRGGKRCGRPAVGHRDLDAQYPRALRGQVAGRAPGRATRGRLRTRRTAV